jgi:polyisoprenoid-binding protein YceI
MKSMILLFAAALSGAVTFAQTWKANKPHSHITFTITHLAVSDVDGSFKDFDATIKAARPDFSDAVVEFVAKTASISTGDDNRDKHIKSADFFDVLVFPDLTFRSSSIKPAAKGHYTLTGSLTLHGVTKPVSFDMFYRGTVTDPQTNLPDAGFVATGIIKRSDFGFAPKFGSPLLSDEVTFKASGEFSKEN